MKSPGLRAVAARLPLGVLCAGLALGQTYTVHSVAGGGVPNDIPATSARFSPYRVAVDSSGNAFIADSDMNVILRVDATSSVLTVVAGNGIPGFGGDGGAATDAQLNSPVGIAFDRTGNLYIADSNNDRIRKVSAGVITTVAGSTRGFSGDGGPATNAQLNHPVDVAFDTSGNLYIAEQTNDLVRKVSNGVITTFAGNGYAFSSGDNGPATKASFSPSGIAFDAAGNLYIADTRNNRLREVSNGVITTVAGNGSGLASGENFPAINAQLSPADVAVDAAGNLFVADGLNNRIRRISKGIITTFAGTGVAGFSGDNGPATSAMLYGPGGIAIDASGSVYITDSYNNRLRRVLGGVINTIAGGSTSFFGENGPATGAQLGSPYGLAIDSSGNLYITDIGVHCVFKVSNGVITTVAGNGVAGFSGDNGPATKASLNSPSGAAVDSVGNIYITDTKNNRVREVSNGVITTVAGNGGPGGIADNVPATSEPLFAPVGVAVDSTGDLYIGETSFPGYGVRRVANGMIATVGLPVDGAGVAVDAAGNLYVGNGTSISKATSGFVALITGGACGTAPPFQGTGSLTVDASGNVYFANTGASVVCKVSNGVTTTIAGNGLFGFGPDNGPAAAASFGFTYGVAVDASFNVYVADSSNHRVRLLTPSNPPCPAATVIPASISAQQAGQAITISVSVSSSCSWAIQGMPSWITYSGNAVGNGAGSVNLTVAPNPGVARSGVLTIADVLIPVAQPGLAPSIAANGVVALDSATSVIQPGSLASIFGSNLATGTFFTNGALPTDLGNVTVTVDGKLAYLVFVSPSQINFQAPDDTVTGPVNVVVTNALGTATSTVTLSAYAPSFMLFDSRYAAAVIPTPNGSGYYANGSYDLAGPAGHFSFNTRPAKPGEVVELYGVGFGPTNPPIESGIGFGFAAPTVSPVAVTIGGVAATVQFSGLVSPGLYQLNVVVPSGLVSGDQVVQASVGGASTSGATYLTVQ